jgi:iron(III) transport system ATP-binding protein
MVQGEKAMISVRNVTLYYSSTIAVDSVSLEVDSTAPVVIAGPSGSGKTSLLRLIAGLEIPHQGEIYINDFLVSKPGWAIEPQVRNIGYVFQTSTLWPHMTVAQNIGFGLHNLHKAEKKNRIREQMETMSLDDLADRYPHQISGGEARRVSLARALAPRPKNLLMDEPLTNVDPDLKERLLAFIMETVVKTEACLLYVTHDIEEATAVSGRIMKMENGRLGA